MPSEAKRRAGREYVQLGQAAFMAKYDAEARREHARRMGQASGRARRAKAAKRSNGDGPG